MDVNIEGPWEWAGQHPGWAGGKPPWRAMAAARGGGGEGDKDWRAAAARRGDFPFGPPGWGGAVPWGGRGRGGRGGWGGRARRGDVRTAVLLLLSETPRNGYQIIQELTERSRGAWRPSPGSVYPVLQQLEDEGLVISTAADVGRLYRISDAGTAYIDSHRDAMGVPWEDAADAVGEPAMEAAQLIPQVLGAMKQVLRAGSDRQIRQANALLLDTRRALYRILADDAPEGTGESAPESSRDVGDGGQGGGAGG